MKIEPFVMERMQSTWENQVEINLSESGVHPLTRRGAGRRRARARRAARRCRSATRRPTARVALREAIAAMYPGATAAHVEVTNGGSEANFVTTLEPPRAGRRGGDAGAELHADVGPGARVRRHGCTEWPLREDGRRWRPDLDALRGARHAAHEAAAPLQPQQPDRRPPRRRRPRRDLPRGRPRTARGCCRTRSTAAPSWTAARRRRCGAATSARSSRAACRRRTACPACASAGSSGPPGFVETTWAYHDYTTIAPGAINDRLATLALAARIAAARILARTRRILRENWPALERWLRGARRRVLVRPARGRRHRLVRYHRRVNSTELTTGCARRRAC